MERRLAADGFFRFDSAEREAIADFFCRAERRGARRLLRETRDGDLVGISVLTDPQTSETVRLNTKEKHSRHVSRSATAARALYVLAMSGLVFFPGFLASESKKFSNLY
jgi:hypothetical protein